MGRHVLRKRSRLVLDCVETCNAHAALQQQLTPETLAIDFLLKRQTRPGGLINSARHLQQIAVARRLHVARLKMNDNEDESVFLFQLNLFDAVRPEPFGARALHELELVRVVHDSAGVGVLPVDP
jgi:hypothetical protein